MKPTTAIFSLSLFIVSCTSSQKMLEQGHFDKAITISVEKLQNNPENTDELVVLKKAFEKANLLDRKRIESLNLDGTGDNWNDISELYARMGSRQHKIMLLPSEIRNQFEIIDYESALDETKYSTADRLYRQGLEFMQRGDRPGYRKAWAEFIRVSEIYPSYEDVDQKIKETRRLGTTRALFVTKNNSGVEVPDNFTSELSKNISEDLDIKWLEIDIVEDGNISYDQRLELNLTNIIISPETLDRQTNQRSKEIQDGFIEKRDSLGKSISRIPKMITVDATVMTYTKTKSALVDGSLNFYEYSTGRLILNESLSEEIVFKNKFREFYGDERVFPINIRNNIQRKITDTKPRITFNDSRGLILEDRKEIPFPTNDQLLLYSIDLLKEKTRAIIRSQRDLMEK